MSHAISLIPAKFSLSECSAFRGKRFIFKNGVESNSGCVKKSKYRFRGVPRKIRPCQSIYIDDDDDLVDVPISAGDGFSFTGGKYSNEIGPAQIWQSNGKFVSAYAVQSGKNSAKDPIFGLKLAESSQASGEKFRWFVSENGTPGKPHVLLLHGLPSQSYSFRKVFPEISDDFHIFAPDWLGFGFSDKPQPSYGFDYTQEEYSSALASLVEALELQNFSIVVQGYFAPAVVEYVALNKDKIKRLVLINPPITEQHSKLPSSLSSFSNFLLGEIFAQDPIRASDSLLNSCNEYFMEEEDAMVYRSPYLFSGSAGFALTAISRQLKANLKKSLQKMRAKLSSPDWTVSTAMIWGSKDKWLPFTGVSEFASSANIAVTQLPQVGHHAQEDFGEEVGKALRLILRRLD